MIGSFCLHSQKTTKISEAAAIDRENHDEVRLEPVFALSFVEHDLQRAQPQRNETQPDVINLEFR